MSNIPTSNTLSELKALKIQLKECRIFAECQDLKHKINSIEEPLFNGNSFYVESVSNDDAENYVLKDKSKYTSIDKEELLKQRLSEYRNNSNLSHKWKTRMTRVVEYKLKNINSDGFYCQGFVLC